MTPRKRRRGEGGRGGRRTSVFFERERGQEKVKHDESVVHVRRIWIGSEESFLTRGVVRVRARVSRVFVLGIGVHTRDEPDGIVRAETRGQVLCEIEFNVREIFESGGVFLERDESDGVCERRGSTKARRGWTVCD